MIENRPVARALYPLVEAGDHIPVEMYESIAEIIAMVYQLEQKNKHKIYHHLKSLNGNIYYFFAPWCHNQLILKLLLVAPIRTRASTRLIAYAVLKINILLPSTPLSH